MQNLHHRNAAVSVIVPTHNRSRLLQRVLDALRNQIFPRSELEVVVVADGCQDDTLAMLAGYRPPYRLIVVEQAASGAARARNAGAAAASAPLLIFLDDDVEPTPGFVNAHVEAHAQYPGCLVLGPYPPVPRASSRFFRIMSRRWWTEHFDKLGEVGHRFTYRDLLTGNLSLHADLWRQFDGLDPEFEKSREDYEFGARLIEAGVPFMYAPQALGFHHEHETMTLEGAFRRAYQEGRMDVVMGRKHPNIGASLDFVERRRNENLRRYIFDRSAYALGGYADPLARAAVRFLPVLEWAGLRESYERLFSKLRLYWYLRGVGEQFSSFHKWKSFAGDIEPRKPDGIPQLDLREGLEGAEAFLDANRPQGAQLRFGNHEVGDLPPAIGAEPWRGVHLRPYILLHLAGKFLRALALDGEIEALPAPKRDALTVRIEEISKYLDAEELGTKWQEQYEQWEILAKHKRSPSPPALLGSAGNPRFPSTVP